MEQKNELNDIILNKNNRKNGTKKVLLSIATFSIVLIIVVIIMNRFNGGEETTLPHAQQMVQPPVAEVVVEPDHPIAAAVQEQTSTEPAAPESEPSAQEDNIQRETNPEWYKEKAAYTEPEIMKEPVYEKSPSVKTDTKPAPKQAAKVTRREAEAVPAPKIRPSGKYNPKSKRVVDVKAAEAGHYYIQVGSFAKYSPSRTFLKKIADRGYTYTFHKVNQNGRTLTKVLVGPFNTNSSAREALPIIKKSVIPTAFLVKL
ncbi:MAG: SPOR domain-containing protein [Thiovulaceae bacterium]|nr:SPOR domain-containing protein [Sulfurimonadaceae bacterium]